MAKRRVERRLAAILASDVVGYSRLMEADETATIATESALTGHLVLSSLHTNDAPSAIPRLIEMGIETFIVASAIDCVVAQRLARKLCEKCRESYKPEKKDLVAMGYAESEIDGIEELLRPVGCASCAKTGYRGRRGIFEALVVSPAVGELIMNERPITEVVKQCRAEGMLSLFESGLTFVADGATSFEEVVRVAAA